MDAIKDSRDRIKHREATLSKLLRERIVLIDGAMGTMIQKCKLSEEDFRGDRFKDWEKDLKGNNDILNRIC